MSEFNVGDAVVIWGLGAGEGAPLGLPLLGVVDRIESNVDTYTPYQGYARVAPVLGGVEDVFFKPAQLKTLKRVHWLGAESTSGQLFCEGIVLPLVEFETELSAYPTGYVDQTFVYVAQQNMPKFPQYPASVPAELRPVVELIQRIELDIEPPRECGSESGVEEAEVRDTDTKPWMEIKKLDQQFWREALVRWNHIEDKHNVLRQALATPQDRGAALRLLLPLDDDTKKMVFEEILDLCSVGHSDIHLVRAVVMTLPRRWVLKRIWPLVERMLVQRGGEEEYRRFAELLQDLDDGLLAKLLAMARTSDSEGIREIAEDFSQ